jgi:hypothetical protein
MTETPTTIEQDPNEALIACVMAERGGAGAFTIEQMAILRGYVEALNDHDADAIAKLRGLLPPVVARAARAEKPTLALDQMADDVPVDVGLLSDWQLLVAENLAAVGQGRACPLNTRRLQGAADLIALLDRHAADVGALLPPDRERFRVDAWAAFGDIVSPLPTSFFTTVVVADDAEVLRLRERVEALEHELSSVRSGKIVPLTARQKAEREGPITAEKQCHDLAIR